MVAWAVWDCNSNRELVSLLLTRPFGIYHFLFLDLISILFWHMSIKVLVLVLVHCVPCTSLTWWRNIDVTEITPFTVYMTLSPRCRETPDFIPAEGPSNSPDLNPMDYSIWGILQERSTIRGSMMWSWKNVFWASGGCWTTPSSQQQWLCSGVVVRMHVFAWMVDFWT